MTARGAPSLPVVFGAATVAAKVALSAPRLTSQPAPAAITWLVVSSFVVVGLVLMRTELPQANGWACLLVAAGTVPSELNQPYYAGSFLAPLGYVLDPLYLPAAVALVLRYPRGRLTVGERRLVLGLVAASSVMRALSVLTVGRLPDGARRPAGWRTFPLPPWWHDWIFVSLGHGITALFLLATGGVLIVRIVLASGLSRRSLAPLAVIGALCALAAAVDQGIWALDLTGLHLAAPALLRDLSAALLPVALLADLLRRRAATAAVSERVLLAARSGDAWNLQQALRGVLVDPTLVVAVSTGRGSWVDSAAAVFGQPASVGPAGGRRSEVVCSEDGRPLVTITCDAQAVQPGPLWSTALTAVRIGAENLLMSADLLSQMSELRESRGRIVEAALLERRRVERDLHDGAQQRFLAVATTLARADLVGNDKIRDVVDDARAGLAAALRELRELARGIHPAALTQGGLAASLSSLTGSADMPVEVRVDPDLTEHRPPMAQESAVYFFVAEALTNATRYAGAGRVTVDARRGPDGLLAATVSDDGTGGARLVPGGGLAGLADRFEALGGRLTVHADPCSAHPQVRGTTLQAVLPAEPRIR